MTPQFYLGTPCWEPLHYYVSDITQIVTLIIPLKRLFPVENETKQWLVKVTVPHRYVRVLPVQPPAVLQSLQVPSLISLAGFLWNHQRRQRHQDDGDSHRLQGTTEVLTASGPLFLLLLLLCVSHRSKRMLMWFCLMCTGSLWQVWQRAGPWVCKWRPRRRSLAVLNIQQLTQVCPH